MQVVVTNVGVAFVGSSNGITRIWNRNTASLSSRNSAVCARRNFVTRIWWLAFSTGTKTAASSTRILYHITRTGNQFNVDIKKVGKIASAENVVPVISGDDGELIHGNVAIASDSDGVKNNLVFSSDFRVNVIGGSLEIGVTFCEVISARS